MKLEERKEIVEREGNSIVGPMREERHVVTHGPGEPVETAEMTSDNPGWRASQLVYMLFAVIDGLLLIRLVLKLLGANPHAGFASFIYGFTDFFMAPFRNLLPAVGSGSSSGAVLETSVVIAIIVYALLAWVLARLIVIMFFRNVTVSRRSSRDIGGPRPY
jgi:uncharacterized protein YggT (Ycf19 family)